MKLVIDDKACVSHRLTLEELLIAVAVRRSKDFKETLDNLVKREVVVIKGGKYLITQRWNDVVDEALLDSKGSTHSNKELLELARKMRECYPEGKMPGTPYYYRANSREVKLQLKKFLDLHGDYPDEEIVDATKRFVASFRGDYRYLPIITNFISKDKENRDEDGESYVKNHSSLADFLENKGEDMRQADDWTYNMRV